MKIAMIKPFDFIRQYRQYQSYADQHTKVGDVYTLYTRCVPIVYA